MLGDDATELGVGASIPATLEECPPARESWLPVIRQRCGEREVIDRRHGIIAIRRRVTGCHLAEISLVGSAAQRLVLGSTDELFEIHPVAAVARVEASHESLADRERGAEARD